MNKKRLHTLLESVDFQKVFFRILEIFFASFIQKVYLQKKFLP